MSDHLTTPAPPGPPPTRWEAIRDGQILGAWSEDQFTPDEIRACRDEWHPGALLRVTTYTATVTIDSPGYEHQRKVLDDSLTDIPPYRPVCPECRDGKHPNCAGSALDVTTDDIVACACDHGDPR